MENVSLDDVKGGSPLKNLEIAIDILKNREKGIKQKIVEINAAYAIMAAGKAEDLNSALKMANASIVSGKAIEKLGEFVKATGGNIEKFQTLIA